MSKMYVGEGLVIEGSDLDNVAHIDLLIGPKDGPVGQAFASALCNQSAGHTNLLAVVSPNIPCKPQTVMITKVTMKGSKQVMQMFGPAQAAVARAVVDSVIAGVLPKAEAENWVIVCGVFIAGSANDNKKIYKNNYEAVKLAIKNAMTSSPSIDEIIKAKREGLPISGSELYLRSTQEHVAYSCTPTAAPHVDWMGRFAYPCRELPNHVLVDLLAAGSYENALAEGARLFGAPPSDCSRCGERCYVELSSLVRHPLDAAREGYGYLMQARRAKQGATKTTAPS